MNKKYIVKSARRRPGIPIEAGHLFRSKAGHPFRWKAATFGMPSESSAGLNRNDLNLSLSFAGS